MTQVPVWPRSRAFSKLGTASYTLPSSFVVAAISRGGGQGGGEGERGAKGSAKEGWGKGLTEAEGRGSVLFELVLALFCCDGIAVLLVGVEKMKKQWSKKGNFSKGGESREIAR